MTGNGLYCWDDLEVLRKYLPDEPVWSIGTGRAATPGIMGGAIRDALRADQFLPIAAEVAVAKG